MKTQLSKETLSADGRCVIRTRPGMTEYSSILPQDRSILSYQIKLAEDPQYIANQKTKLSKLLELARWLISSGAYNGDTFLPPLRILLAELNMPALLQDILFDTDKALESLKEFTFYNPDIYQPHDISLVNASLALAAAYGNLRIVEFIVEKIKSFLTDDVI